MNLLGLLALLFFSHGSAQRCVDVFSKSVSLTLVPRLQPYDVIYESFELSKHGEVLNMSRPTELAQYKQAMLARDGVYLFLVDRAGSFSIDHQLPLPINYLSASFHGNHLGLYKKREQDYGFFGKQEIVFAGELLVVSGKVVWISDGSMYFYDAPKVPQRRDESDRDFRMRQRRDRSFFIETVKGRLLTVQSLLLSWGWIDGATKLKQLEEKIDDFEEGNRRSGFLKSRQVALFERNCRNQPSCWEAYSRFQNKMDQLDGLNGFAVFNERFRELIREDVQKMQSLAQLLPLLREQGTMAVFSQQINALTGELQPALQEFIRSLDWYISILESRL